MSIQYSVSSQERPLMFTKVFRIFNLSKQIKFQIPLFYTKH